MARLGNFPFWRIQATGQILSDLPAAFPIFPLLLIDLVEEEGRAGMASGPERAGEIVRRLKPACGPE